MAVAELRPVRKPGLTSAELLARWKTLPAVNAATFRNDLEAFLNPTL